MRRDFRLYELNDDEFEKLVIHICTRLLGPGVTPFAAGRDGGRDGKFEGTAQSFPSSASPLAGICVLQAKHVAAPDRSCSDADFKRQLNKEHPKVKRLIEEGLCDHYIVFTNRKLTSGADEALIKQLMKLGLKSAHIVGLERLSLALEDYVDIAEGLPNHRDLIPFRFDPQDIVDVVGAIHDYTRDDGGGEFDSAHDFDLVSIRTQKNKINGLSSNYYAQAIVAGSMPHFAKIEAFLKNPRNGDVAALYHDAADELKGKILVHRGEFETFDHVFAFLYERIQNERSSLRGKRRLISVLLHYMYCNCDIGDKDIASVVACHADS
jgi:hypothetical protein